MKFGQYLKDIGNTLHQKLNKISLFFRSPPLSEKQCVSPRVQAHWERIRRMERQKELNRGNQFSIRSFFSKKRLLEFCQRPSLEERMKIEREARRKGHEAHLKYLEDFAKEKKRQKEMRKIWEKTTIAYQKLQASLKRMNKLAEEVTKIQQENGQALQEVRKGMEENRKGLEENRKGLEENRKGLEENRKVFQKNQKALQRIEKRAQELEREEIRRLAEFEARCCYDGKSAYIRSAYTDVVKAPPNALFHNPNTLFVLSKPEYSSKSTFETITHGHAAPSA